MIGRTNAGFGSGGGGGLRVAVGLTAPANPRENTVWVKSASAGKTYVFSEAEPESPSEGLIWFLASSAGAITVANVYTGEDWMQVDTYMYLSGEWVQITVAMVYLIRDGDQCAGITGGWKGIRYYWSASLPGGAPSVTWAEDGVSVTASGTAAGSLLVTEKAIDVTRYSKLTVDCTSASSEVWLLLSTGTGDLFKTGEVASVALRAGVAYLDISAFSGMHYIGIQCRADHSSTVKSILMK